jgi:hypothetical protein
MRMSNSHAPAWLFSFVDLAFLLLIAMTQLGGAQAVDLGEIIVPRIQEGAANDLPTEARDVWQVRVHPPAEGTAPFELVPAGSEAAGPRLARAELDVRLAELQSAGTGKPILAPHQDSRSQDLLDAVQVIEDRWPGRRRATVAPLPARR